MKNTNKKEKGKFSAAVVAKVVTWLKVWIDFFMGFDAENLKITVSKGNKKIGNVLNVSLAPIVTCMNCAKCMYYCYDIKAVLAYPSVLYARARNTALFYLDRDLFFAKLHQVMRRRKKNKYLRFHVSGEIVDIDHFVRMVETAKMFPDFKIWTYTKMYTIINAYCDLYGKESIPGNFTVMFSEWEGVPMDNKYNFPVFNAVEKGTEIKGFKCPGNCQECINHGTGCVNGKSATVELH